MTDAPSPPGTTQKVRSRHAILVLYVLVMVLVFLAPVPTGSWSVPAPDRFDKAVHFGIFLGFAFLYDLDRRPSAGRTLLVSFAFAGGIELVQWILPYRSGDWWDFTAGAVGAGIGAALARSGKVLL